MTTRTVLSTQEVAETLGVTPQTVRNYIRAGLFPGARKPLKASHWLIPSKAVTAFVEPPAPESPAEPLARSPRAQRRGRAA